MLPLLMFVFMAVIDFSRLLLSYTMTSASVRNALRYGVILGLDENNQNYLNCAGIENTASSAYFTSGTIDVKYERPTLYPGDTTTGDVTCDSSLADGDLENGDILVVEVSSTFDIITPFVPFDTVPVNISGRRTLVKEVLVDQVASASSTDNVPLVAIVSPDPSPYTLWTDVEGNSITFTAFAEDTEDGDLTSAIIWAVDGTDTGDTGATYTTSSLAVGSHTIQARVTDSDGNGRSNSLRVDIIASGGNTKPVLSVSAPSAGTTYNLSDLVTFMATATDTEDGDLSSVIDWYIDGALERTTDNFSLTAGSAPLTPGSHDIRAVVEDSGGLRDFDFFTITINDPSNAIPTVTITLPDDTSGPPAFDVAATITFEGTAEDPDGDAGGPLDITGDLVWRDSGGSVIGTGGTFTVTAGSLGAGPQVITASAADAEGASGSASVTIDVTASYDIFLATLYIWVEYEDGGSYDVRRINDAWDETSVTWFNQPTSSATPHSFSTDSRNLGHYVPFEITTLVENWYSDSATYPNYGLLIDATSNNDFLGIASREAVGGSHAPYIQVYLRDGVTNYFCDPIFATADAYVKEAAPWVNFGGSGTTQLWALQGAHGDKHILMRFDTLSTDITNCP
jgi:hypothetical protein